MTSPDVFVTCGAACCEDEREVVENFCWGCGHISDHSQPHPKHWPLAVITYSTGVTVERFKHYQIIKLLVTLLPAVEHVGM